MKWSLQNITSQDLQKNIDCGQNTSEKSCPGGGVVLAKILLQFIPSKDLDYISERTSESLI